VCDPVLNPLKVTGEVQLAYAPVSSLHLKRALGSASLSVNDGEIAVLGSAGLGVIVGSGGVITHEYVAGALVFVAGFPFVGSFVFTEKVCAPDDRFGLEYVWDPWTPLASVVSAPEQGV
jgi:hypothetical protein